ncbi:hypothetical protein MO973_29370 [Paenibacillus sp. TRM 82003]|nr:hypothetical protein [Paenibacillus sp. TRM 82003]
MTPATAAALSRTATAYRAVERAGGRAVVSGCGPAGAHGPVSWWTEP